MQIFSFLLFSFFDPDYFWYKHFLYYNILLIQALSINFHSNPWQVFFQALALKNIICELKIISIKMWIVSEEIFVSEDNVYIWSRNNNIVFTRKSMALRKYLYSWQNVYKLCVWSCFRFVLIQQYLNANYILLIISVNNNTLEKWSHNFCFHQLSNFQHASVV